MATANIVYWYGLDGMPRDGGGLRALAWYDALTHLGFETHICPLRTQSQRATTDSLLRKTKKRLLPMPFASRLPAMDEAEVNVITVPAVFASAAAVLPSRSLIFDWMDLWSVNARTMGKSSWLSTPGGLAQSLLWARRQRHLVQRPAANVYAGYDDKVSGEGPRSAPSYWIPGPITATRTSEVAVRQAGLHVGFIGNFAYPPNVTSLREFFQKYGANFRAKGIKITIAGFGSEIVHGWNVNATVLGRIDSLTDFYEGIDAAIVPIDYGGGLKTKAVEAMAYGVPVFGTPHVASGFAPEWTKYIGRIEHLLEVNPKFPPVPSKSQFERLFSQRSFDAGVKTALEGMGRKFLSV